MSIFVYRNSENKILTWNNKPIIDDIFIPTPFYEASGGVVTYDGDYKIHTFNSSSNLIVNKTIDASVLMVGGGGRGSRAEQPYYGGAGGGGGQVKS